ncbi:hypothetical protein [Pantoea sp.]|uniref:hypothetical protein n=1 Tax=Pantoea sp. TaxID=69393 RepID=UPI0031D8FCAF
MSTVDHSHLPADLVAIHESKGMQFLNEQKKRSFSLNILYMNGEELLTACAKMHDPDIGFSLMGMNNKEASEQAHREVKRYLHNFVAAAMTLVDHTRVMLNESYKDQPIHLVISDKIKSTVGSSPICKFMQDMRNYIVHKGLPNSQRYMHANNNGNHGFTIKTGIHIETASLYDYNNWKALSKTYLENASEFIEIHELVEQYVKEIKNFNQWLDVTLEQHHADELRELYQLQAIYNAKYSEHEPRKLETVAQTTSQSAEMVLTAEVNQLAEAAKSKIAEYQLPIGSDAVFHSQRPHITFSEQDMLEDAVHHFIDEQHGGIVVFMRKNDKSYGIATKNTLDLQALFEKICNENWAINKFDYHFVFDTFLKWNREYWHQPNEISFYDYLRERCRKEINMQTIYYPIAQVEIACAFNFGPVIITPLSAALFDSIEQSVSPTDVDASIFSNFKKQTQEWRRKYQGTAAVQINAEMHPSFFDKNFYTLATHCIDILRFFSPWSSNAEYRTSIALKGADYLPTRSIFAAYDGGFMINEGLKEEYITQWQMTEEDISILVEDGLAKAGKLIDETSLTPFERNIRTAMILFSKGCNMIGGIDRLHYTLSAAEEIYLRHDTEHAESLIAKRISHLIERNAARHPPLKPQIAKAYFMRNDYKLSLSPSEREAILNCTQAIHHSILIALENMHTFSTKEEFIYALESGH